MQNLLNAFQAESSWQFWLAIVLIVGGFSLFLGAAALQAQRGLRKWTHDRTWRSWRPAQRAAKASRPDPAAWMTARSGYAPETERQEIACDPALLAGWLRRLQSAADRLEAVTAGLGSGSGPNPDSPLKTLGPDVEYVFKASQF